MKRKIVVLGSNGMLGQMVERYFSNSEYEVTCFNDRFLYESRNNYTKYLQSLKDVVVINCVGRIKQKGSNIEELLQANTVLPAELRNTLGRNVVLIHPSTDCVFMGDKGAPYVSNQRSDAEDDYGWSKRLGEVVLFNRFNTLIPRVSIIGPDSNPGGLGLLGWIFSNPRGSTIKGFVNHLWNGITTLEWCKQIELFLHELDFFEFSLIQFGTREYYSKYEMLQMFNEVFDLGLSIKPVETELSVDRRLFPDIVCKPLLEQLYELKAF